MVPHTPHTHLPTSCVSPRRVSRFVWSHNPPPGKTIPDPCNAPGCTFAHNRITADKEYTELLATEAGFQEDQSKAGRCRFSKWRMEHAARHFNVQPALYGRPMVEIDLDKQILEPLHYAELGIGKTPWKYGMMENASDDAREAISDQLAEWNHGLDTRRADAGRDARAKWFTGAKWATFCKGEGGSPGGPKAIARLVKIVADDLQQRGATRGSGVQQGVVTVAVPRGGRGGGGGGRGGGGGGRGKCAFGARNSKAGARTATAVLVTPDAHAKEAALEATIAQLEHVPTAMQRAANPEHVAIIRRLYGSRAQTILNILLSFDAYFAWYYALKYKSPKLFTPDTAVKEARALDNCRSAIDMHEIFERLTIRRHKSYLIHGAIFKVTRDILLVGDVWAFGTSALELMNADTKRLASALGSKHQELSTSGKTIVSLRGKEGDCQEGPARLVNTKGHGTTMCISTLKNMLAKQQLRAGEGIFGIPDTRRRDRLLYGSGRLTLGSTGVKMEGLDCDDHYDPQADTCLAAFIRVIAGIAVAQMNGQ